MNYPIKSLDRDDKKFPELLKQIHKPPKRLFYRGNIKLLTSDCFSVVGTRKITAYGKEAVHKIIPGLTKYFTIVSGMALGVDSEAHRACLASRGRTIAVLGSGISDESIYPREHLKLAREILESEGLIISEYPPETKAMDHMFPERNRIISGLSKGVLIVEADEKSGTLITARLATEQNRDVFAVPGSIFSSRTFGPHMLIRNGAKLVVSAEDILEEYDKLPLPKSKVESKDPNEQAILEILKNGPLTADSIIEHTQKETSEVLATLSMMELAGLIAQNENGLYYVS